MSGLLIFVFVFSQQKSLANPLSKSAFSQQKWKIRTEENGEENGVLYIEKVVAWGGPTQNPKTPVLNFYLHAPPACGPTHGSPPWCFAESLRPRIPSPFPSRWACNQNMTPQKMSVGPTRFRIFLRIRRVSLVISQCGTGDSEKSRKGLAGSEVGFGHILCFLRVTSLNPAVLVSIIN